MGIKAGWSAYTLEEHFKNWYSKIIFKKVNTKKGQNIYKFLNILLNSTLLKWKNAAQTSRDAF